MNLRGIKFQPVLDASGVRGFFGEGYRHHALFKPFGLDFKGATFVSKTTTFAPRAGNMPLREDFTPAELRPKCIVVKMRKGVVLNSVGLSGPGAEALLATGKWQSRTEPFMISFMSVGNTLQERAGELASFLEILSRQLPKFRSRFALQINFSCPNVGHKHEGWQAVYEEAAIALSLCGHLLPEVPVVLKYNVLLPAEIAKKIADHPYCDALCVSNTIPWGQLPDQIDWKGLFGSDVSPLAHLKGGGLSGKPLVKLVSEWIRAARDAGIQKPIIAGGGILKWDDVSALMAQSGPIANPVSLGSIAILRPWRVAETIECAHQLYNQIKRHA